MMNKCKNKKNNKQKLEESKTMKKKYSHLTCEDNPAFRVIVSGVDPSVSREENCVTSVMDSNL